MLAVMNVHLLPQKLDFVSETIPDVEGFTEEEVTDMVALGIGEGLAPKPKHTKR